MKVTRQQQLGNHSKHLSDCIATPRQPHDSSVSAVVFSQSNSLRVSSVNVQMFSSWSVAALLASFIWTQLAFCDLLLWCPELEDHLQHLHTCWWGTLQDSADPLASISSINSWCLFDLNEVSSFVFWDFISYWSLGQFTEEYLADFVLHEQPECFSWKLLTYINITCVATNGILTHSIREQKSLEKLNHVRRVRDECLDLF